MRVSDGYGTVGRGPVPRRACVAMKVREGQTSRYGAGSNRPFTVGRGPVPRHAADESFLLAVFRSVGP